MSIKKLFLIDASGYLFKSYFAITSMTDGEGMSTNALYGFIRSVNKLIKEFSPEHIVAVFDGRDNKKKRRALYPEYKAHREKIADDLPHQIAWAQTFCALAGIPLLAIDGVEADDTMGTAAIWAKKEGADVFLCTSDKDMCQIVDDNISILNTHKNNEILGPKEVEEKYGVPPEKFIDYLSITGDSSDNIPGLHGFGPKTAAKLLQEFSGLDEILAHPERVAGAKKQETIRNERDKALMSRELVTLDMTVEIPHSASFYALAQPDISSLKEFYAKHDFTSLLKELGTTISQEEAQEEHAAEYILIDNKEDLEKLVSVIKKAKKPVCFDTETTSLDPITAELVGIGFCINEGRSWYIPAHGALGIDALIQSVKPLFEDTQLSFYGHNVKYDYHILKNYDIDVANICFDTLIASYLLNAHLRRHSLDALALVYFKKTKISIEELIGKGKKQISMKDVPLNEVCTYCCEDVDYTCRLKKVLEEELSERSLTALFKNIELPLIKILAGMERHGIYVDTEKLKSMSGTLTREISIIAEEIYSLAGVNFAINSPKQLSEVLFNTLSIPPIKKTTKGHSTDAEVLEKLAGEYPIAAKILEYRTLEKLRSTYVDALPNSVNAQTKRIHCTFNQSVTATGRLSCQNPNLQNIPIRTSIGREIREAFLPQRRGWKFLAADYSQIELRLMAHLADETTMIQAFNDGEDIHRTTAAQVFHTPLNMVTERQRTNAKAINFGIIYGQQAFGLARELGIGMAEAASFIKEYFARFPRIRDYMQHCVEEARKRGKATTMLGRERLIPEIYNKNGMIRSAAERLAINTPLQGSAADLIKHAMIEINALLKKKKFDAFMILQVHDELIFETPQEEIIALEADVKKTMEGIYTLKVPLIVDIAVGKNWKEC